MLTIDLFVANILSAPSLSLREASRKLTQFEPVFNRGNSLGNSLRNLLGMGGLKSSRRARRAIRLRPGAGRLLGIPFAGAIIYY